MDFKCGHMNKFFNRYPGGIIRCTLHTSAYWMETTRQGKVPTPMCFKVVIARVCNIFLFYVV